MIKVVFFAALREQLDCSQMEVTPNSTITTVDALKAHLAEQGETWQSLFANSALLSAVNHDMVANDHPIKSGDEVAFFPPVTGG